MTGRFFASAQELGPDDAIMRVDDDPFPGAVTSKSVRLCWQCEAEIYLKADDYVEAIIRYQHNYGHGTSHAKFCDRECWRDWASTEG